MKARVVAALVWTIVVLQVVLVALGKVFEALGSSTSSSLGPGFVADALAGAAALLAFPAVGAVILSRRPGHPIGWIFCTMNLGWAINNFAGPYAKYALVANPGSLPAGKLAVWLYFWPGFVSTSLFVFLGLLFPDGTLLSRRWRPVAWLVAGYGVVAPLALAFAPGPVDDTIGFKVTNPAGVGGSLGGVVHLVAMVAQLLTVPLFAVAAVSLILRQRRARGQERQQLKWFTSSVAVVAVLVAAQFAIMVRYGSQAAMPGWARLSEEVVIVSAALIPAVAAGIAILKYRLYEIDLIINRTLVYGSLTVSLAAVYVGSVVGLQALLRALTGQNSQLAVVGSTLFIAALFSPLRRYIQSFIDRRFYRKKYNARKTLEAFSSKLRDETDLNVLCEDLTGVVRETMQPAHVSLWLRPDTAPQRQQAN